MATEPGPKMRPDDVFLLLLVALAGFVVVAMVTQSSWMEAAGALGFLLFTLGWIGMHLRLRRELPDHPLAVTSYVLGPRRSRRGNFLALIGLHWKRHRFDSWTALLSLGFLILVGALAGGVVSR